MYHYTAVQWLFFFFFYCFFGWCFESTYVSICKRKFVNRGFIRGPFLPLYGSGAIMMLLVSAPVRDNLVLVFFAGCIGATALEYVTGVVMEALFKVRYWDYSHKRFNFQGQICLSSSLCWGALTVLMTRFLHPAVERLAFLIPPAALTALVTVVLVWFSVDFAFSFQAAMDLRDILVRTEQAKKELTDSAFNSFSGGEKAMAMYVPLFAALAAQYIPAGKEAPQLMALDEAFAGVDETNIESMFALVHELGFDYIMNSQALWGCYPAVSSLNIAELWRPQNAQIVTVLRYHWDGHVRRLEES